MSEEDKYIILLICRIKKNNTNELSYKNRNRFTENKHVGSENFMVTSGERLVWGINWEFGIDMYSLLYLNRQPTRTCSKRFSKITKNDVVCMNTYNGVLLSTDF